ncbi:MAG: BamA/TamA family outer membrane protein [Cytophagales bacterium]|nr:BamA/TamA family outer membrane protein [Cytophagales bacterium]
MKANLLFIFCISIFFSVLGHKGSAVVENITLVGNKKTKDKIILRELDIHEGDTILWTRQKEVEERNRNKVFNTQLFVESTIKLTPYPNDSTKCDLVIQVKERWYIFPSPILELADRNFNEWWADQNRDYSRLEYGIRFTHENFRGRKEQLRLVLQGGFTNKYELSYTIPYINKKQTTGLKFSISYSQNKQVAFQTNDHKLDYYKSEKILRERFYTGISLSKRNKFYGNHYCSLIYHANRVHDSLLVLNDRFFLNNSNKQKYFRLYYRYTYDKRDVSVYPLKGYFIQAVAEQTGLGIFGDVNMTLLRGKYTKFFDLTHQFFSAHSLQAQITSPRNQGYFQVQGLGLGYGETLVRGYELNVVDGQHTIISRHEIKRHLFSYKHNLKGWVPIKQFNVIPYSWYFKTYFDIGYVVDNAYNPLNERLANRILIGYGAGIDIFSFYDFVMRLEYSFNNVNEHGFFLSATSAF